MQTSTPTPSMHQKLTEHEQNKQLQTITLVEIKNNSINTDRLILTNFKIALPRGVLYVQSSPFDKLVLPSGPCVQDHN